jgi:hypothetical protein
MGSNASPAADQEWSYQQWQRVLERSMEERPDEAALSVARGPIHKRRTPWRTYWITAEITRRAFLNLEAESEDETQAMAEQLWEEGAFEGWEEDLPDVIVEEIPEDLYTDRLKSDGAAQREVLLSVEHRQPRYLNNRAENSHQPTRQRERRLQGFKSAGHAQRFLSAYGPIAQHFRPRHHLLPASEYRQAMAKRFHTWQDITSLSTAA